MLLESYNKTWDFELLDTGAGFRLERWGKVILQRPDPQIIWQKSLSESEWTKADAIFQQGVGGEKGRWEIKNKIPEPWIIKFPTSHPHPSSPLKGEGDTSVKFHLKLSPFKHTGIFAEQAANWEYMIERLNDLKFEDQKSTLSPSPLPVGEGRVRVLNLFAYTGGATMVLAKLGCKVTHVDASKPAISWANENSKLNNLPEDAVRWILDDAVKFVKREIKRGNTYDGIIMDPPAYGRSPEGKIWKFNENLPELLSDCFKILSTEAKFLIINGYATNSSAIALKNLLEDASLKKPGRIEFGELCLNHNCPIKKTRLISTGIFSRISWSNP